VRTPASRSAGVTWGYPACTRAGRGDHDRAHDERQLLPQ